MTAGTLPARRGRMSLWRLEWLRMTRTPRAVALGVVYIFIGLLEPVTTRYENDLVGRISHVQLRLPPPTPADGLNAYVSEISLIGLIVLVVLAAGALNIDSPPGLAVFLRTRVSSVWQLIGPRFAVYAGAAVLAYLAGTLAAWYETSVLIGPLPAGGVFAGALCGAVYLVFAVAVTAAAASLSRATIGVVVITLGFLLLLPVAGLYHSVSAWLPSALVTAPVDLVSGTQRLQHFGPALAVAAAASALAVTVAVARLQSREI
jgi:ABC-2 type transport system permease protein